MKEVLEFLNNESEFGIRVMIGNEEPITMSREDVLKYLFKKEVEIQYIEVDGSAIDLLVNGIEVSMFSI